MRKISPLFLVLIFGACSQVRQIVAVKDLRIKFLNVEIAGISLDGIDLNLNFRAHNPNRVNAVLTGFAIDIFANNFKLGKAQMNRRLKIPPQKSKVFTIPLHLRWKDLSSSISSAIRKKNVTFRAVGYALIDTPLGKLKFKVADYTRSIK